jgi:hypothetical protein
MKAMMYSIRTLKIYEYKGCRAYLRNFGATFEYLVFFKGELYTSHIVIKKSFLQKIFFIDYKEQQLSEASALLMKLAETTIDLVLEKK